MRERIIKILYNVEFGGAYSNIALKNGLDGLDPRDRAFVSRAVYGVISRRLTLDYIIGLYSKIKLKKISKYILLILRLGIYQLLYMDKVPQSAAVNESVKLAKRYGHSASAGFVNGVLRSVARDKCNIKMPADPLESMSVRYSFPKETVEYYISRFGEEFASELMESLNREPAMTIRANRLKISRADLVKRLEADGIRAKENSFCGDGIDVSGLDTASSRLYKSGYFTVQDAAAMTAARILDPKPDDTVIDLCAAPGGKTTYLAELMENKGIIRAFDIHENKIGLIRDNAERLGITIISARASDASVYDEKYTAFADCVLADVPCSGSGIARRKPELKYSREDISGLLEIQAAILENAARYTKPGGVLVYSTCSLRKEENEDTVNKFLEKNKDFRPESIEKYLPHGAGGQSGMMTFFPNVHGTDGFFAAKLRKAT